MSVIQSENRQHNTTVNASEMARSIAVAAAGSNQSAARTADINFHRIVLKSAIQNNCDVASAMSALLAMGAGSGL